MTSVESTKGYESTYKDSECQEMYESSMGEFAEEQKQLQQDVKAGPKSKEAVESFIERLKDYINSANVPIRKGTTRLSVSDVDIILSNASDKGFKGFNVQIKRSFTGNPEDVGFSGFHGDRDIDYYDMLREANMRPGVKVERYGKELYITCTLSINVNIDPNSGLPIFKIPGLEGLNFKDNDEVLRVLNLLLRFKKEKIKQVYHYNVKYSRSSSGTIFQEGKGCRILTKKSIDKYYPTIKGSKEFIDYINNPGF